MPAMKVPQELSPERMVGPPVPCRIHAPVFRRFDRVVHGNRASCSPRPLCGPVIWNVVFIRQSSCRYDVTDPFHAASGLPEHLFGPMI